MRLSAPQDGSGQVGIGGSGEILKGAVGDLVVAKTEDGGSTFRTCSKKQPSLDGGGARFLGDLIRSLHIESQNEDEQTENPPPAQQQQSGTPRLNTE